jgi:hypothetical protein
MGLCVDGRVGVCKGPGGWACGCVGTPVHRSNIRTVDAEFQLFDMAKLHTGNTLTNILRDTLHAAQCTLHTHTACCILYAHSHCILYAVCCTLLTVRGSRLVGFEEANGEASAVALDKRFDFSSGGQGQSPRRVSGLLARVCNHPSFSMAAGSN